MTDKMMHLSKGYKAKKEEDIVYFLRRFAPMSVVNWKSTKVLKVQLHPYPQKLDEAELMKGLSDLVNDHDVEIQVSAYKK